MARLLYSSMATSTAARVSLKIAYGYEGVTEDVHLVETAVEAMDVFCATARPGLWLVDSLPFRTSRYLRSHDLSKTPTLVRHVPSWFPGAKFKRLAEKWRSTVLYAINHPFDELKRQMVGHLRSCACRA